MPQRLDDRRVGGDGRGVSVGEPLPSCPSARAQGVDDLRVGERAGRDRLLHREALVERQIGEQDAGVLVRCRQRDRAEILLDAAVDDDRVSSDPTK
jgi:hypothetical protein